MRIKILHKIILFFILEIGSFGVASAQYNIAEKNTIPAISSLRTGDLIFEIASSSEMSRAITDATAQTDSLKFSHVGIVEVDSLGSVSVIEASEKYGVVVTPLEFFLFNAPEGAVVKRVNVDFPIEAAIRRAKNFIGRDYDWWYLPENDEIYCSELVEKSYLNYDGTPIFQTIPMNFRDSNGIMPEFWIKLYSQLGMEIPEGIPGTNPTQISHHPCLQPIGKLTF